MAGPQVALATRQWFRRGRLWVAPTTGAAVAFVAGVAVLVLDRYVISTHTPVLPTYVGSPETATTVLSVTASAMATLTALVLTIVTIVMQLASNKYSHRALRTFLQDRHYHLTLATFVGTFTYALLALVGLDATIEQRHVVGLTIPVAFVLAVITIGVFVSYVDHIVHAARGTSIIDRIGAETRDEIERIYDRRVDGDPPQPEGQLPDEGGAVFAAPRPGVVYELDFDGLLDWAAATDAVVEVCPAVGDFIPGGAPLLVVHGGTGDGAALVDHVKLDPERTITDDVGFGFRLLVDIAERALSPAVNDPTTAVQCIDQLHDLLRRLVQRRLSNGWHVDASGVPRLYITPRTWERYVSFACDEIRVYGEGHLQVMRRLREMLEELGGIADDERRAALDRQLHLVAAASERGFADPEDRTTAMIRDAQGIGGRSD